MDHELDDAAARELRAELRRLADTILDLEARGRLLSDASGLLKLLADARGRLFAWEVRLGRPRAQARSAPSAAPGAVPEASPPESDRVVEEAVQREEEAEQEWLKPWEGSGEGEL